MSLDLQPGQIISVIGPNVKAMQSMLFIKSEGGSEDVDLNGKRAGDYRSDWDPLLEYIASVQ